MPSYHTHNHVEQSILPEFEPKPAKSPARRFFALSERFGSHPSSAASANGKFRDSHKRSADTSLPPLPPMPLHLPLPPVPPLPALYDSFTSPRRLQGSADRSERATSSRHTQSGSDGSCPPTQTVEIVKTPNDARRGMRTGVPSWGHAKSSSVSGSSTSTGTRPRSEKPMPRPPSSSSPDSYHLATPPTGRSHKDTSALQSGQTPPRTSSTAGTSRHGSRTKSLMPQLSLPNLGESLSQSLEFPPELGAGLLLSTGDRKTFKPPPKGPIPAEPFRATLRDISLPASGEVQDDSFLVTLSFAYSLAEKPDTSQVILPLSALRSYGGRLLAFIDAEITSYRRTQARVPVEGSQRTLRHTSGKRTSTASSGSDYSDDRQTLMEEQKPEMTDGESAEDSEMDDEYGLTSLLRDEYLRSLWVDTPMKPDFLDNPPPMPITHNFITPPKHKARTRNQFVQQGIPARPALTSSVSSPALRAKAQAQLPPQTSQVAASSLGRQAESGEIKILLMRDAVPYHLTAHRLLKGSFPRMEGKRRRVEDELRWLGMDALAVEVTRRSLVLKGGEGYI